MRRMVERERRERGGEREREREGEGERETYNGVEGHFCFVFGLSVLCSLVAS